MSPERPANLDAGNPYRHDEIFVTSLLVNLPHSGKPLSMYMARIASGGLPKTPNQRS
jgi:hypothetical protein